MDKGINEILDSELFDILSMTSDNVYIFACDIKTNISRWSVNAVDYFDMPGEYMEDALAAWIPKIHESEREPYVQEIGSVFAGTKDRHCFEYRVKNKYGEYVWLQCNGVIRRDENGDAKVFAGIMNRLDIKNKYDPLTNLMTVHDFNSKEFECGSGCVMLVEIEGFRDIGNSYGMDYSDKIAYEFSCRLQEICSVNNNIYKVRENGVIIVSPQYTEDECRNLFNRIKDESRRMWHDTDKGVLPLSIIGGAIVYPNYDIKREMFSEMLEYCLKKAKKSHRGKLVFYSRKLGQEFREGMRLKQAITQSVQNDFRGFSMYFQPLVEKSSHKTVNCEALLRWFNDDFKNVGIQNVIKILEKTGDIRELGYWIMDGVMKQAKIWQDKYENFSVSFNVSYLQFKDHSFVEKLIACGRKHNIKPELINIELTESSKIDDFENLITSFKKLRSEGYKIALDDFGIAYSTLLLIRNLPVDFVKIDHSFVLSLTKDNVVDLAIIESIVSLCSRLNIEVVVEGVENSEILEIIEQYPVSLLQGYYFDKPMPVEEFNNVICKTYTM